MDLRHCRLYPPLDDPMCYASYTKHGHHDPICRRLSARSILRLHGSAPLALVEGSTVPLQSHGRSISPQGHPCQREQNTSCVSRTVFVKNCRIFSSNEDGMPPILFTSAEAILQTEDGKQLLVCWVLFEDA